MALKVDLDAIRNAADVRLGALKRFEATVNELAPVITQLEEIRDRIEDMIVCYNDLDEETKKAVPSHVAVVLMRSPVRQLETALGDGKDIGLKHLINGVD